MTKPITIALDAMGGDHGPPVTIPAALTALQEDPELNIVLVGDETTISQQLTTAGAAVNDRLVIQHASQQVEMDDLPSHALRNKKDSSMRVAIN
ncbi:MAG: phosphate acyltransferase, partial [Gammaproteobacteria bacterium]